MYQNYILQIEHDSDHPSDSDYITEHEDEYEAAQNNRDEQDQDYDDVESGSEGDIDLEEFFTLEGSYNYIVQNIIDQGFLSNMESLPDDYDKPFELLLTTDDAPDGVRGDVVVDHRQFAYLTKQQFCQDHANACAAASISYANSVKLLENIRVHAGNSLNLPFTTNRKTGKVTCRLNDYLLPDSRDLEIHVCINGCVAFILEFRSLSYCPVCRAKRFHPCQYGNCRQNSDCDAFAPNISVAHRNNRNPQHIMYWRSIILKMLQLYKKSVEEDPTIFAHDENRHKTPGHATDLFDGEVPREQIEQMREQHRAQSVLFAVNHPGVVLHQCSLIFSVFNDGDQLFQRKSDSMWPMIGSIWNCDPSYRTKLGLGLFLIALHNLKVGSGAVQSMMDNIFAEELRALKNGLEFSFTHNGELHYVYLQARCVYYHLDTRAYEKMCHVQAAGAMATCPDCSVGISGASRKIVNTRCYIGHSSFLPRTHMLRYLGQKKNCENLFAMPQFDANNSDEEGDVDNNSDNESAVQRRNSHDQNNVSMVVVDVPLTVVDSAMYYGFRGRDYNAAIGKFLSTAAKSIYVENMNVAGKKIPYSSVWDDARTKHKKYKRGALPVGLTWINKKFPFSYFASALSYAVSNNVICPETEVTHEIYCERGLTAKREREKYESKCRMNNRKINSKKTFEHEGVKGISMWAKLRAPMWQWLGYDLMHCGSVSVEYHLNTISGERGCDLSSRQLSLCEGRFLFLKDAKIRPPWVSSTYMRRLADSIHKCIIIPTQYKADYEFDFPSHHLSYMGSHDKLVFMTVFATYYMSFLDITTPYKMYYRRYSEDLTNILNPCQNIANLPYLKECVIETTVVREGLFPDSEMPFIFHELVHIVRLLTKFGVVGGLMCFFGERCMHILGMGVPEGGLKYIKTTKERFVAKENCYASIHQEYKKNASKFTDNNGKYSHKVLKMSGKCEKVYLSDEVKTSLFDSLFEFLNTQIIDEINTKSAFMRIHSTYLTMYGKNSNSGEGYVDMCEWIDELFSYYGSCEGEFTILNIQGLGYLINDVYDGAEEEEYLSTPSKLNDLSVDGILLISDFGGIIKDMATFGNRNKYGVPIAGYSTCIVKGVEFRGRGAKYAESFFSEDNQSGTNNPMDRGFGISNTTNPLNNLNKTWQEKTQSDSWCSVSDFYMDGLVMRSALYLGQCNYYFRIVFPSDSLVHGLPFANMVLHKKLNRNSSSVASSHGTRSIPTNYDSSRDCWFLPSETNYFHAHKQFVPLVYVDATSYGLSALNITDQITNVSSVKPMKFPRPPDNVEAWKLIIHDGPSTSVSRINFLALHPERLITIEYSGIEEDRDSVKVFEQEQPQFYRRDCKK